MAEESSFSSAKSEEPSHEVNTASQTPLEIDVSRESATMRISRASPPRQQRTVAAPAEDEYPSSPTFFYFAVKFALGALTLLVAVVAYSLRPYACDGTCSVPVQDHNCGPIGPRHLFFHRIKEGHDETFLESVRQTQPRKGFNWISLTSENNPNSLLGEARKYAALDEVMTHVPWDVAIRGNHTFYDGIISSVDWSKVKVHSAVSIALLRNPRERLYDVFNARLEAIPAEMLQLLSALRMEGSSAHNGITFKSCLISEECRSAFQLRTACQEQARMICGIDCIGDEISKDDMITRAQTNLKSRFGFVGLFEVLDPSLSLFRKLFPTFFEFLPTSIEFSQRGLGSDPDYDSGPVSKILDDICAVDEALYESAFDVLRERGQTCGLNVDEPTELRRQKTKKQTGFSLW